MVKRTFWCFGIFLLAWLLILPTSLIAGKGSASNSQGKWWDVVQEDEEVPPYETAILYSEIGPRLREIEKNSNRVKVDVIGQSAGGCDLFLVTVSDPQAMGRLGRYQRGGLTSAFKEKNGRWIFFGAEGKPAVAYVIE